VWTCLSTIKWIVKESGTWSTRKGFSRIDSYVTYSRETNRKRGYPDGNLGDMSEDTKPKKENATTKNIGWMELSKQYSTVIQGGTVLWTYRKTVQNTDRSV